MYDVVKKYAIDRHKYVNQYYADKHPYEYHLNMVINWAEHFKNLLFENEIDLAFSGCWGHDLIEDTRLTYNDIKNKFGKELADIIYDCTEYRGRDPEERKPIVFYQDLLKNPISTFVKLCDILANTEYSIKSKNRNMFNKHKKTFQQKVVGYMYNPRFDDMYNQLEKMYESNF